MNHKYRDILDRLYCCEGGATKCNSSLHSNWCPAKAT